MIFHTDTTQGLVKQQDEWPCRECGFITNCVLKSKILSVSPEIVLKNDYQWLRQMHANVTKYELPNYKGARISVPSSLNIPLGRYILKNYDLPVIGDYLQFGFPINVDFKIFKCNTEVISHTSALQRKQGVDKYFTTEVSKKAMLGPFEKSPLIKYIIHH